jgi:hypothetical protein
MSDVANAPNMPPPVPAPAPQQAEVPVNPNPVSTPAPIGSQAPDKVAEASSRRESIQKAFAKARTDNPPQPRRAKVGDNHPPEPIDPEKPTIDLKKRPDDQPQVKAADKPKDQRDRAEHGHFAPRQQEGHQPPTTDRGVAPQQPGVQHAQLPANAPYREPPQRMHERAKADWHATPESVRGDIYRAQGEFQKAYQTFKGDHEVMNTIRPFHEMARQQNTTLERALNNYVSMENKLRQDPIAGLDTIVYNLNLQAPDGTRLTFRDLAWHHLNQTPEQQELLKNQNKVDAQAQQIGQLSQTVNKLVNGIQQMQYQQTFTQTRAQLDRYADAKPRFDELSDLIEREIKLGFTLDQAYARADLLRPATQAAQTRTPPAQTRTAAKSISGAPAGPSNGVARRDKPVGRREAITSAIKRANGSL